LGIIRPNLRVKSLRNKVFLGFFAEIFGKTVFVTLYMGVMIVFLTFKGEKNEKTL